ncbi:MAG: hypothetical protein GY796_31790 [Chloroflexi bacterium]|nr:hypothetical protein [Chloroflexota bacterium]
MEKENKSEDIPKGQVLFDRIFMWFILSMLITGILYTVWGLIEIFGTPPSP